MTPHEIQRESRVLGIPENEVEILYSKIEELRKLKQAGALSQKEYLSKYGFLVFEVRAKYDPRAKVELIFQRRCADLGEGALLPEERAYQAVFIFDSEVKNGGFDQYFGNSSGDSAPMALAALGRFKAEKSFSLLERGMKLLGTPYPIVREERWKAMGRVPGSFKRSAALGELDSPFYAAKEDIVDLALCAMADAYRKNGIEVPDLPEKGSRNLK